MAIRFPGEQVISLTLARTQYIPRSGGHPISPSTLWRWIHRGCRSADGSRVRLECITVGGRRMTSVEALARFFGRLSAPDESQFVRLSSAGSLTEDLAIRR
jgi:hypothetical protein